MSGVDNTLLAGKCLLVVEKDMALARRMCRRLEACGAYIVGPAPTVHYARLVIGRRRLDGAILDFPHPGKETGEFIDLLIDRGVPIVFAADVGDGSVCLESLIERVAAMKPVHIPPAEDKIQLRAVSVPTLFSVQERFARAVARALRSDPGWRQ